eukprot:309665_1
MHRIKHVSIFGKAMKQCKKERKWGIVIQIMELAVKSEVDLDTAQFTMFFDAMQRADKYELCQQYLNIMTTKYGLQPDAFVITSLIKGCKPKKDCVLAEKYWNWMHNLGITPTQYAYNEMVNVYSESGQSSQAIALFNEFSRQCKHQIEKDFQTHLPVFRTHLNTYCRDGDIEGMNGALCVIVNHG